MFENNDIFGINDFRDSFNYIYKANTVKVTRQTLSDYNKNYNQGDFLGIKTIPKDNQDIEIEINIMSQSPSNKKLENAGYQSKGNIEYTACCSFNIELKHDDIIKFKESLKIFSIKKDEQYRVQMEDEGLYQGQFCFKFFKLVRI